MSNNQSFQLFSRAILFILMLSISITVVAESFYFIQLKNKDLSPYQLDTPEEFLSKKAIDRRIKYGIAIDSTDFPVNPNYVSQIANTGIKVHSATKWLNGLTVLCNDTTQLNVIRNFDFVASIQYTGEEGPTPIQLTKKWTNDSNEIQHKVRKINSSDVIEYGNAKAQTEQINADAIHQAGYFGKGVEIAVIDAGFKNANINRAFDSLRLNDQLLGTYNVVYPDSNVYVAHEHGANVLSIMGGNLANEFLGIAPKASYRLILSEYSPTEYLCEVDFWVRAIEYADSIGSDVINSSLGYAYFDDPNLDFSYADMDGKTSRASIAASMAAEKGIIVCSSAGNEGLRPWKYIGSPADADKTIAVGAATIDSTASTFSSFGPASDGRVKPDISARGTATSYVNYNGIVSVGNGTSYSSPVIAGAMACLLEFINQNQKVIQIEELLNIVRANSHLHQTPDSQLGYGLPDFEKIMNEIDHRNNLTTIRGADTQIFTINYGYIQLRTEYITDKTNILSIYDTQGRLLKRSTGSYIQIQNLVPGVYILRSSNLNINSKFTIYQ